LIWLKVRLTGRALLAYRKFLVTTRATFKNVVAALQEHFEPQSKRDSEFQARCKKWKKSWADYGEDLRILVDKVYPILDDDARQQLALQRYLSQLQNDQVAFGVKQRKPKIIEAAGAATLELESYLITHSSPSAVAPVQVPVDHGGQRGVMDMMAQLMTCTLLKLGCNCNTPSVMVTRSHGVVITFLWCSHLIHSPEVLW